MEDVDNLLLLIDGNSFLHRTFYAYDPLSAPNGLPTNAVYGTLKMLETLLGELRPTHLAVCLDASRRTFRNELYPKYKANRKPPPDELVPQFKMFREALTALNIPYFEDPRYEGDDLLGSIAKVTGIPTRIATGDKDAIQLVNHHTRVLLRTTGSYRNLGMNNTLAEMGYPPCWVIDIKALSGDTSDNIPGVPKVGEKTALKLLRQFGSVEAVIRNATQIPGALGERIVQNIDTIKVSYKLATIKRDCLPELDTDSLRIRVDIATGRRFLETLGIKAINYDRLAVI